MKNLTWNERKSPTSLGDTNKRGTFPFMKNHKLVTSPSVRSWNSFLKLSSRLSSSQTLTVSSSHRYIEKYIFVSPTFCDIPEAVWKRIMSFLDPVSLAKVSGVCKSLHDVSLNADLWQLHCINANVDCGPGIEHLLEKVGGNKGKWWREVYIRGILGRNHWIRGNLKKRLISVTVGEDAITCFKFDNDKVIVGTRKNRVQLFQSNCANFWEAPIASPTSTFDGCHRSPIMCLDFLSSNGNLLATGDADGTLALWNVFTGELLAKQKKAHEKGISQMIMLDSRHIATCGFDKSIRIYRLQEYVIGRNLDYSPTSSRSSSNEKPVKKQGMKRFFSTKVEKLQPKTSLSLVKEFRGHKGEIYCMTSMTHKTKLVTGSTDKNIKVCSSL
jgi:WD40 repeat protein